MEEKTRVVNIIPYMILMIYIEGLKTRISIWVTLAETAGHAVLRMSDADELLSILLTC